MNPADFAPLLSAVIPELGLLALILVVMGLDLFLREEHKEFFPWIVAAGLLVVLALTAVFSRPLSGEALTWGGMLRQDGSSYIFRLIFLAGAALTALFTGEHDGLRRRGEFYALMLVSTMGMSLMAAAADLILLYLAIETTSIPLYILSGFVVRSPRSVEAGLKYLLFGAMTSAVMLYGFSWLYGFSGSTQLYALVDGLAAGSVPLPAVIGSLILVLVGFGFKISAAPFHFWAPDVYQGAPTSIAGFLSTASKAAGFAVLIRVLAVAFEPQSEVASALIMVLAVASMIVGNYLALVQKNARRLLAYSSIAQAGYILIGLAAGSELGITGAVYYLMAYLVTNLAAFAIVQAVERMTGSEELNDFRGLNQRSAAISLALAVVMLSLGGIPPFAGFFAKIMVFAAALESGLLWLVIVGVLNAVVGLYYYLTVLRYAYQHADLKATASRPALHLSWHAALAICILGVLVLGTVFLPWFGLASAAASSFAGLP